MVFFFKVFELGWNSEFRKLFLLVFRFQILLLNDTFVNIVKKMRPTWLNNAFKLPSLIQALKKYHTHTKHNYVFSHNVT